MKTISQQTAWQTAFQQWKDYAEQIQARAKAITDARHDKGWKLAASVGIPHDGCCLHNASIDDKMTGWCKDNPHRLAIAKQASRIVGDWRASRIAHCMIQRKWNELLAEPFNAAKATIE